MGKAETGILLYHLRTTTVDPGANWKGYYVAEGTNGFELNSINGISYREKLFLGFGAGYLNFKGNHGLQVFGNVEYIPLKRKFSQLLSVRAGKTHLWNQYKNGVSTALIDFAAGVNYRATSKINIYFSAGYNYSLQSGFVPLRSGIRF